MRGFASLGMIGVAVSLVGCGRPTDAAGLSESLNSKIIATQVALRESVGSEQGIREAEIDLAERQALQEAEAQLQEAAAETARDAEAARQQAMERLNPPDPYAGRPATELSEQLPP